MMGKKSLALHRLYGPKVSSGATLGMLLVVVVVQYVAVLLLLHAERRPQQKLVQTAEATC